MTPGLSSLLVVISSIPPKKACRSPAFSNLPETQANTPSYPDPTLSSTHLHLDKGLTNHSPGARSGPLPVSVKLYGDADGPPWTHCPWLNVLYNGRTE